jgi:hypothetical protein
MIELPATSPTSLVLRSRRPWRQVLMALVIFLGGAACGSAITIVITARFIHHSLAHPEQATEHITRRLTSRLNLTAAQSEQVRQVVGRRQSALAEIRRDIQPRLEAELSALEAEIDSVLNGEQRAEWRALADRFRAHWLPPVPASAAEGAKGTGPYK